MKPRVFIVDDHIAILRSLEIALPCLLPCEIAGTARNAAEALKAIPRAKPDVLWLDLCMAGMDGPSLLLLLRARGVSAKAVFFTGAARAAQIREAMSAEPEGFVSKADETSCWQKALEAAAEGGSYCSPSIAKARRHPADAGLATLTDMERIVFGLLIQEMTNEEIAEATSTSAHTARHHREHVMKKLGVHSVAGLCSIAGRAGLLG